MSPQTVGILASLSCLFLTAVLPLAAGDPKPVSKAGAEHYKWGDNCDAWYLVKNDQLNVIEELMPPGTSETLHYHQHAQQFFYILEGTASMTVGAQTVNLASGEGIQIAPGTPHQIRNKSGQPLRILVTSQPPSHGDKIDVATK